MPRILGVDVPNDKSIWVALTYIYGVGTTSSQKALADLQIDPAMKARDLGEEELARIAAYIETNFTVEGQLRRQRLQDIGRLKDIGCYRGLRHRRGLPVRGQRTRCNARTRKGPKKTIANKKIARK
ncbi:MAG: 30S ribosomal protein S13 [Planctomycetes bacterium]|nr:30S ribosomal protein S13 [Planctomycetota bacterium]